MPVVLRPYQVTIHDKLRDAASRGMDPICVSACGSGKGTIISAIFEGASQRGNGIIFGVHGKSLVADVSMRVSRLGIPHGILMGGVHRERWHPAQVASVDTLYRMEHIPDAAILIVDEAHQATSPTWLKVIDRAKRARLAAGKGRLVVIGLTATPVGPNGRGLGRKSGGLFDEMVFGPSVIDLIRDGYLVRSRVLEPPPIEGAREIKLGKDDNLEAQAAVFDKVTLIGDELKHYRQYGPHSKSVWFCTNQKHATNVARQFTEAGTSIAYVDSNTPLGDEKNPQPGTRAAIWRDLAQPNGNLMGVANCGITLVGWDCPIVSYGGILRRSGSFGLWHQMLGRFSRTHSSKDFFFVADHAGNTQLHAPTGYFESPIEWSLDGKAVKEKKEGERRLITCRQSVMNCWCGRAGNHDGSGNHAPCYGTFFAGPRQCPWCGCPVPKKDVKIEVQRDKVLGERQRDIFGSDVAAQVAKIFRDSGPRVLDEKTRRHDLDYFLGEAARKGHNPSAARYRYIGRYNEPPPDDWMPPEWQAEHPE